MADNQHSLEAANQRELAILASKVQRLAQECEALAEDKMGLLLAAQARKFHKATKELQELGFWLQNMVKDKPL